MSEWSVPEATRRAYDRATVESILVSKGIQKPSRNVVENIAAIVNPTTAAVLREEAAEIRALPVDNADVMATRARIVRQLHARADALDP